MDSITKTWVELSKLLNVAPQTLKMEAAGRKLPTGFEKFKRLASLDLKQKKHR